MSGRLLELIVSCDECGATELLTVDDLPDDTPIHCRCGQMIGRWEALKAAAIPAETGPPKLRVVR